MKSKRRSGTDVPAKTDFAILQGPTEDGQGARVVRVDLKGGTISAGEMRPAREGEPLHDRELVRLRPLDAELPICEVEVLHAPQHAPPHASKADKALGDTIEKERSQPGSRPARVSTESYRKNWNTVFARKRPSGLN